MQGQFQSAVGFEDGERLQQIQVDDIDAFVSNAACTVTRDIKIPQRTSFVVVSLVLHPS